MDYLLDSKIDETALDIEWLQQAAIAIKWGNYSSDCDNEVRCAEENVKLVRSELIMQLMENPEAHLKKGVKPTGPVIEAFYRNHKKHKKAKKRLFSALVLAGKAEIAKKEICVTRKKALEELVRLHGLNYFAGPSMPRNLPAEIEKRHKKNNVQISNKLKRKRT